MQSPANGQWTGWWEEVAPLNTWFALDELADEGVVEVPQGRFVVRVRPPEFANEQMIRFDHQMMWRLVKAGLPVPSPQKRPSGISWVRLGDDVVEIL